MYKDLTPEDKQRLKDLNAAVDAAIKERTDWLDSKMNEYASVKIGEEMYNDKGIRLGRVIGLYRYQANQNRLYDTSLNISYRYIEDDDKPNFINNTSSQMLCSFIYTKEEALKRVEWELEFTKIKLQKT